MTGSAALSRSGCGAFAFLRDGHAHGARGCAESTQTIQHRRIIYDGGEALRAPRGGGEPSAERGVR